MKTAKILIIAICLLMPISSLAFDGNRKGFVLGGGLGFAPVSKWDVDVDFYDLGLGSVDESKVGVAVNFIIGGAFDEHNMLVYEGNVTGFNSDLFNESVAQGFNGAVWYHYFGPTGKSAFTAVGLGLFYFKVGDYDPTDPGGAILLGGGYEFARHWQVGAYAGFGKTTDSAFGLKGDFTHSQFSILVSAIAF